MCSWRAGFVARHTTPKRCRRCGEARTGFAALCVACLSRFAWCRGCKRPRRRIDFGRRVREGRLHGDYCLACRREREGTGAAQERSEQSQARYRRIAAYVRAHPGTSIAEVVVMLGVSAPQVDKARRLYGFSFRKPAAVHRCICCAAQVNRKSTKRCHSCEVARRRGKDRPHA
jgi:hypothetical protein